MLHNIFYVLHVAGMATILLISSFLLIKKEIQIELKKKISLYLKIASHTQLVTGFTLFFLNMSQVNHMKIGIKLIIAIIVVVIVSIYKRKISIEENSRQSPLLSILILLVISVTMIAFLW